MASQQEYHKVVRQWIPATVAVFAAFSFAAFATSSSHAQNSGGHASASSSGSHAATNSHPTSVSSTHTTPARPTHTGTPGNQPRRYLYGGVYAVGVPVGAPADSANQASDDANYQGGPTIFDRRGSGAQSYIPPVANAPDPHPHQMAQYDAPQSAAESETDPTMLIFKDGHQLEVGNYAIVGHNLYDMSPGHSGKVALADIDVTATQKQNEQHGVKFQVPASALAN
jgi:hypothetical protein